jgi:hypothetical protein
MNNDSTKPSLEGSASCSQLSSDAKRCLVELAQDIGFTAETAAATAELGVLVLGSVIVYFSTIDVGEDSAWTLVVQDLNQEDRKASLDAAMLERFVRINGAIATLQSAAFGLASNETLELVFRSKMMSRQVNFLTITLASSLLLWKQCTAQAVSISQPQAEQTNPAQSLESLQAEILKIDDLNPQENAIINNTLLASGIDIHNVTNAKLDAALSQKLLPFVTSQGIALELANQMVQSGHLHIHGVSLTVLSDGIGEECIFIADLKHSDKDSEIQYLKTALSMSSVLMKTCQTSVARWGNSISLVLRCQWPLVSADALADILDNLHKLALTFGGAFTAPSLHHSH